MVKKNIVILNIYKLIKSKGTNPEKEKPSHNLSFIILSKNRRSLLEAKVKMLKEKMGVKESRIFIGEDNDSDTSKLLENHIILPNLSPLKRLNLLMDLVKTEYCVFTADDDLIISKKINDYISFLEKNPDYVGCQGLFFSKSNLSSPIESFRPSLNEKDAETRIFCLMKNYGHFNYAITRVAAFRKMCKNFQNLKSEKTNNFHELAWNIFLSALGKIHVLYDPFVLRDSNPTKGWWYDLFEGNLASSLKSDAETISDAIKIYAPNLSRELIYELILYFIFKDPTCLSIHTGQLYHAKKNNCMAPNNLPKKLKTFKQEIGLNT